MFDSVSVRALDSALDGLAMRQRASADNVANLQTPGYRARQVAFEDALTRAVERGDGAAPATVTRSLGATREDGNNVDLDTETLLQIETNLRYQVATQAMSGTFSSVRTAMRTS
ncbi:flagellar basal body rod protein FlgB [Cellulomonas wangsupingiae]|uniref:Flagellar basal body rod protein FlgB n=1 Tax=Cellulomonas wangsupingiae TaxID=2968085 RepID=A0ABY5K919_9CELL|nr:flagellar biosynthesis protein FlgB [Cellulomonas wangsupingiae]MCC2334147.1 flagellar biosynthesis protein FlgB [Cellulomonas wangsupingiae]UUI66946.1 flagellar biosynthesis protein FlgB [Cellulomonas wangsupingiae]